jgi:hypothetical protein
MSVEGSDSKLEDFPCPQKNSHFSRYSCFALLGWLRKVRPLVEQLRLVIQDRLGNRKTRARRPTQPHPQPARPLRRQLGR